MPRVKGGPQTRRRHKKMIKMAEGHRGSRHRKFRIAKESVTHALAYAYRDRAIESGTCVHCGSCASMPPRASRG